MEHTLSFFLKIFHLSDSCAFKFMVDLEETYQEFKVVQESEIVKYPRLQNCQKFDIIKGLVLFVQTILVNINSDY